MEEKKYHYKCRNNPEHLFETATDDMWCPMCDISTYPMLEPFEPIIAAPELQNEEVEATIVQDDIAMAELPTAISQDTQEAAIDEEKTTTKETLEIEHEPEPDPEIRIGNQIWKPAFLCVKKFKNGEDLYFAKDDKSWVEARKNRIPAWRYPHKDPNLGETAGLLYNFYAVVHPSGLAPEGWDIPTVDDVAELATEHAIVFLDEHLKLTIEKEVYHSLAYGTPISNSGKRVFWTKSKKILYTAFAFAVDASNPSIELKQFDKNAGFFVRCIRPKSE